MSEPSPTNIPMDIAPSTSDVQAVFVTGVDPLTNIPGESNWVAQTPVFEDRYKEHAWKKIAPLADTDTNKMKFVYAVSDKWIRVRTAFMYHQWNINAGAAACNTTVTPLPGFGITNYDQIYVLAGQNNTSLSCNTWKNPMLRMMAFMAREKKNDILMNQYWKMAGFYDFKNFDYCGIVPGNIGAAAGAQLETANAKSFAYQQVADTMTVPYRFDPEVLAGDETHRIPCCPGSIRPEYCDYPLNMRWFECGQWYDKAMQDMRRDFYGNKATTVTATLTKVSLFCEAFNTILNWPPIKLEFDFIYNFGQTARPRMIVTPGAIITVAGVMTVAGDSAVAPVMNFDKDNSYFIVDTVEYKAYIHQALLDGWANKGSAFSQYYNYLELFHKENIVNANNVSFDLISQRGNIPYKIYTAHTVQWPPGNVANTVAPANKKYVCEFAFGSDCVEEWKISITHPDSRTLSRKMWNRFGYAGAKYASKLSMRGVRGYEFWTQEKVARNAGVQSPLLEDCDSLNFEDYYSQHCNGPLANAAQQDVMPESTPLAYTPEFAGLMNYGTHSVYNSSTNGLGCPPHNFINSFIMAPPGFDDTTSNYGIYMGTVRMEISYVPQPTTPMNLWVLMEYQIACYMLGNGTVQMNINV